MKRTLTGIVITLMTVSLATSALAQEMPEQYKDMSFFAVHLLLMDGINAALRDNMNTPEKCLGDLNELDELAVAYRILFSELMEDPMAAMADQEEMETYTVQIEKKTEEFSSLMEEFSAKNPDDAMDVSMKTLELLMPPEMEPEVFEDPAP